MKKLWLVLLIALCGCRSTRYPGSCKEIPLEISSAGDIRLIGGTEFIDLAEHTASVFFFGSTICGHCEDALDTVLLPFLQRYSAVLPCLMLNELPEEISETVFLYCGQQGISFTAVPFLFAMKEGSYLAGENDFHYFLDFIEAYCIY